MVGGEGRETAIAAGSAARIERVALELRHDRELRACPSSSRFLAALGASPEVAADERRLESAQRRARARPFGEQGRWKMLPWLRAGIGVARRERRAPPHRYRDDAKLELFVVAQKSSLRADDARGVLGHEDPSWVQSPPRHSIKGPNSSRAAWRSISRQRDHCLRTASWLRPLRDATTFQSCSAK
jgi:hypothetical protein